MSEKIVRWGILGCGDVTEVKSGPALQKANGSALVAVMRRDGAKAKDYAQRHNVPRWYDDAAALIADEEVDAVYVATPPSSHLELARLAGAAGKPCLVEKPMARTAAECREMIAAFGTTPLFVAYYRRALPAFVRAKAIVDAGALGAITGVAIRFARPTSPDAGWRTDPAVSGGGLFVDLASHALNAMEWIIGPFEHARGDAESVANGMPVEDVVTLTWRCPSRGGALGYAAFNFASGVSEDMMEITGTNGRLTWACFGDGTLTLTAADGTTSVEKHPPPPHVHQPLVQLIVNELLGDGTRAPTDAASSMRTSALIDAALASFRRRE